jgi:hypothetical protein
VAEPERSCFSCFFEVPASVQGVVAANAYSSNSLTVSWQKALGVAERYDILLLNENGLLLSNVSEPATARQHKFEDLTPGKKYKMQILTVSGGLFSKESQAEGRTGNTTSCLGPVISSVYHGVDNDQVRERPCWEKMHSS